MKKPLGFFLRQRKNIVKTIEISDTVKYDRLRYYEGVYTIRNIVPETSDDLFAFLDNVNMIPGYIDSNSTKALSILGNNKKLLNYTHRMKTDKDLK